MKNLIAILVLACALLSRSARADEPKPAPAADLTTTKAADVKWMEAKGFPKGVMASLIAGDPGKAAFIVLLKIPAGTVIAPHTHTADEGGVVISGSGTLGKGDKVDEKAGAQMAAGSTYSIPAKVPHWFKAKTETTIARFGAGAADVNYVNPKDDPRGK